MPITDPLVHLPVSNFAHMGHVVILDGCLDLGPSKTSSYFLTPVRINLRSESPEKDLDTIIATLVANRVALKAKIRAATALPATPAPVAPPQTTGPRKKFPGK